MMSLIHNDCVMTMGIIEHLVILFSVSLQYTLVESSAMVVFYFVIVAMNCQSSTSLAKLVTATSLLAIISDSVFADSPKAFQFDDVKAKYCLVFS